jgi:ABC-type glycerol-3-phosphate transport system permease component
MKSFFDDVPRDFDDAALVDGATRFQAFRLVALRYVSSGLAATAILTFIFAWNEFLFALTFIKDDAMRTLPVALQTFIGRAQADWGMIMAGSVLFTLPIVAFFLIVHRRLVQGMAGGALR